jgi:hypothetical protein
MVNIAGIVLNVIMLLLIISLIILGVIYNNQLNNCIKYESPLCYTISCPCDEKDVAPCNGNAKKKYAENLWICANATKSVVDDNGEFVKKLF